MKFNVNSPILFVLAGVIILAVVAQSVFFLVRAWKHGLEIGMDREKLKNIHYRGRVHHRPGRGHRDKRDHPGQGSGPAAALAAAAERGGLAVLRDHRGHQRRKRHGPHLRPGH